MLDFIFEPCNYFFRTTQPPIKVFHNCFLHLNNWVFLPTQSKINYLMQGSKRPLQHLLHSTVARVSFCCAFTSLIKLCKNAGPTIFLSQTSMSFCLFQCGAIFESWPGSPPSSHMRTGWHSWLSKRDREPAFGSHMNENRLWEPVFFCFFKNWTGCLTELPSDSQ
jgi:hypothetical protein